MGGEGKGWNSKEGEDGKDINEREGRIRGGREQKGRESREREACV